MTRPMPLEIDPEVWAADAREYILDRTGHGYVVTADDLRRDLHPPHHPNAVGVVFRTLAARDLIVKAAPGSSKHRARHGGHQWGWAAHPARLGQ